MVMLRCLKPPKASSKNLSPHISRSASNWFVLLFLLIFDTAHKPLTWNSCSGLEKIKSLSLSYLPKRTSLSQKPLNEMYRATYKLCLMTLGKRHQITSSLPHQKVLEEMRY